jgi:Flp pilus assembly protein TadG
MIRLKKTFNPSGQALTEMLLVIPLLFLLAAGAVQFTILFQARNAFDQACGETAREYSANQLKDSTSITKAIWNNLGLYQSFFREQSLELTTRDSNPTLLGTIIKSADKFIGRFVSAVTFFSPYAGSLTPPYINYTGQSWIVTINCTPPSLVAVLFPSGVPLQAQLTVLKYPN